MLYFNGMENKLKSFEDALKIVIESILKMGEGLLESVPNIIISIFFLFITWVVYRIVHKLLANFFGRIKLRKSLSELFLKLVKYWNLGYRNTDSYDNNFSRYYTS